MKKKDRNLRIMWSSNAPWAKSGYANQTADLLPRFVNEGWDVACSAFYGLEGGIHEWNGIKCYPKLNDTYGDDAAIRHSQDFKADITIPFQDSWPMHVGKLKRLERYVPYVPIDRHPVPPAVLERMAVAWRIITYSQFGQDELKRHGYHSTMIPHGVDISVFKPKDKKESRRKFGLDEDAYFFGMVAANKDNPPRKQFQRALDAFAGVVKNHPGKKINMYIHTLLESPNGFNIVKYAKYLGIMDRIHNLDIYDVAIKLSKEDMADLINCFDCLVSPSSNEGFGMPITEAQACGVPAIVTDWTSMSELVDEGKTGWKIKVGYKRFDQLEGFVAEPDVNHLHELMESAYTIGRESMQDACRKNMVDKYDIDVLVKKSWTPLFESIQEDIKE